MGVEFENTEVFNHGRDHLLSVGFGSHGGFSKHCRMFFWTNFQLVEIAFVPHLFHIIPSSDNTILNRATEFENILFG